MYPTRENEGLEAVKGHPRVTRRYCRSVRARLGVERSLPPLLLRRTSTVPNNSNHRPLGTLLVIQFKCGSLQRGPSTVRRREAVGSMVHVDCLLPPVLVTGSAPRVPAGAALSLKYRFLRLSSTLSSGDAGSTVWTSCWIDVGLPFEQFPSSTVVPVSSHLVFGIQFARPTAHDVHINPVP